MVKNIEAEISPSKEGPTGVIVKTTEVTEREYSSILKLTSELGRFRDWKITSRVAGAVITLDGLAHLYKSIQPLNGIFLDTQIAYQVDQLYSFWTDRRLPERPF